jgi:hypothetical protein
VPEGRGANIAASLGGFGGSGGSAAAVGVNSSGMITTLGNHADGIIAQSIGGGGGNGGLSVAAAINACPSCPAPSTLSASVGGFGGAGGTGSTVNLAHAGGAVVTAGDYSAGLRAQSIGGGGNGGLSVAVASVVPAAVPQRLQ